MKPYASVEAQIERLRAAQAAFRRCFERFQAAIFSSLISSAIFFVLDLISGFGLPLLCYALSGVPLLIYGFLSRFHSPLTAIRHSDVRQV